MRIGFSPSRGKLAWALSAIVGVSIFVFLIAGNSPAPAKTTPQPAPRPALSAGGMAAMPGMPAMPGRSLQPSSSAPQSGPAWPTPAYHRHSPRGPLPATLPPSQFSDPRVQAVYAMAAKIEKVLYQQPCYCRCDRELGHTSLLSCYIGTHASVCQVCLMEAAFAYQQTKKGQTPAQIRHEIKRGDWRTLNLERVIARYAR